MRFLLAALISIVAFAQSSSKITIVPKQDDLDEQYRNYLGTLAGVKEGEAIEKALKKYYGVGAETLDELADTRPDSGIAVEGAHPDTDGVGVRGIAAGREGIRIVGIDDEQPRRRNPGPLRELVVHLVQRRVFVRTGFLPCSGSASISSLRGRR